MKLFRLKAIAIFLALLLINQAVLPTVSWALTSGPTQPEVTGFQPVGTSNMVDLSTGDFSYSVPLFELGGYPMSLNYSGGISMEQEASWVGLGWSLTPGAVNRNLRGLPDDFKGDKVEQTLNMKAQETVSATGGFGIEFVGAETEKEKKEKNEGLGTSVNFTSTYDNYKGQGFKIGLATPKINILKMTSSPISRIFDEDEDSRMTLDQLKLGLGGKFSFSSSGPAQLNPTLSLSLRRLVENEKCEFGSYAGTGLNLSPVRSRVGIVGLNVSSTASWEAALDPEKSSTSQSDGGHINFGVPVPMPQIPRRSITSGFSGHLAVGGELKWVTLSQNLEYTKTKTRYPDETVEKPAYGYMYLDKGHAELGESELGHKWLMDMGREGDEPYTSGAQYLPIPYLAHDVFAMSGHGMTQTFRAHRNDVGFMSDPQVNSRNSNVSGGLDLAFMSDVTKLGADIGGVLSYSQSGQWLPIGELVDLSDETFSAGLGKKLVEEYPFVNGYDYVKSNPNHEPFFFKSAGEISSTNEAFRTNWENTRAVRLALQKSINTDISSATVKGRLQYEDKVGNVTPQLVGVSQDNDMNTGYSVIQERQSRSTHIAYATAEELVGSSDESMIKSLKDGFYGFEGYDAYDITGRTDDFREGHHLSQIKATNASGMTYVYGIPVYQTDYEEASFNVVDASGDINKFCEDGTVEYEADVDNSTGNLNGINHYYSSKTMDPYPSSFLLTEVQSPHYEDVTGNGVSDDDIGSAVQFNYQKQHDDFKWRFPLSEGEVARASHMPAQYTDPYDDMGSYTYGEKEVWYLKTMVSKQEVAKFYTKERKDGFGVLDRNGAVDNSQGRGLQYLEKIELYSREELRKKGDKAVPYKTVHFDYEYTLCNGVPNHMDYVSTQDYSDVGAPTDHGKLTLKSVHFTYGKSNRGASNKYMFYYADPEHAGSGNTHVVDPDFNPPYKPTAQDRWGMYKEYADCDEVTGDKYSHEDYYAVQDEETANDNANVWQLHTIQLPSGGKIAVNYEADDYAFVQDRKAMQMCEIENFYTADNTGKRKDAAGTIGLLYDENSLYDVVNIKLPSAVPSHITSESAALDYVKKHYLTDRQGNLINHLRYRMLVALKIGKKEFVDGYVSFDENEIGVHKDLSNPGAFEYLSIRVNYAKGSLNKDGEAISFQENTAVGERGFHPVSWAAWDYMADNTPKLVTNTANDEKEVEYDMLTDESKAWKQLGASFSHFLDFARSFQRIMRNKLVANKVDVKHSWIRLFSPNGHKKGGGYRVSRIALHSEWAQMSGNTAVAGTEISGKTYEYTELLEGSGKWEDKDVSTYRSSGVATFEPMIGREENPFTQLEPMGTKRIHLPGLSHFYERPQAVTFFPAAQITYARVKERNIVDTEANVPNNGFTIHQYYTSREFPVVVTSTSVDKNKFKPSYVVPFFFKAKLRAYTLSQGYSVVLNKMNGVPRATWFLEEGEAEQVSPEFLYNDGQTTLYHVNKVSSLDYEKYGIVSKVPQMKAGGTIVDDEDLGVTTDVYMDTRSTRSFMASASVNANLDLSTPLPAPSVWPKGEMTEESFRSSVITKVTTRTGFVDRVITRADGTEMVAATKAIDPLTGMALVTRTTNEFEDDIYNTTLLARWGYDALDAAYKNYRTELVGVTFDQNNNNQVTGATNVTAPKTVADYLNHGDEVRVVQVREDANNHSKIHGISPRLFVFNNGGAIHLIDDKGITFKTNVNNSNIIVVRPARANTVATGVSSIATAGTPYFDQSGAIDPTASVISASAVEFDDKGNLYCCGILDPTYVAEQNLSEDELRSRIILAETRANNEGDLSNPFINNLQGNWRPNKTYVYQGMRNQLYASNDPVNLADPQDVLIDRSGYLEDFEPFYKFDNGLLVKHVPVGTEPHKEWQLANELTIVDPSGNSLEAKNALDIYSSTIMGYNHELPIASASNSKLRNVGYDGFEDYSYKRYQDFRIAYPDHFSFNNNLTASHVAVSDEESHTGHHSLELKLTYAEDPNSLVTHSSKFKIAPFGTEPSSADVGQVISSDDCITQFSPEAGEYYLSAWVKEQDIPNNNSYGRSYLQVELLDCDGNVCPNQDENDAAVDIIFRPEGPVIDGWQRVFGKFEVKDHCSDCDGSTQDACCASNTCPADIKFIRVTMAVEGNPFGSTPSTPLHEYQAWFDDVRIFPVDAIMSSYVYNPYSLKLEATLDENNYATLYEYGLNGGLERTKKETERGVMTLQASKSHIKE